MLLNELIHQLQAQTTEKITYEKIASILGLKSKQGVSMRIARQQKLTNAEIKKITEAFEINDFIVDPQVTVDYYPEVFGSCGGGAFALSEVKEKIQLPLKLFNSFSKNKTYSVINAIGDSMAPTINDKDRLIVEHWDGEQIKDNHIYIFCYCDEIFVKRLSKNINEIIIKSDNPDGIYRPRYIEGADINNIIIIGEVVGLMRSFKLR